MDAIEADLIAAVDELAQGLRGGPGLETAAADRLRATLRRAAEAWKASPTISKVAANILIDVASAIEGSSYSFPEAEAQRIREFSVEIASLVRDCVRVDDDVAV